MTRQPHRTTASRRYLSSLLLVLALGALAGAAYETATGRWHATPVLSGSMRPGLQPGDVVLTERVPVADLRVRDVIVFHPPGHADRLTVHRIVAITPRNGSLSVTTRGDANDIDDPEPASLSGTDAYRVRRVVPLVGYPAVWLAGGHRGLLVIGLGVVLLGAAVVTAVRKEPRPDQPVALDGPGDPPESSDCTDRDEARHLPR